MFVSFQTDYCLQLCDKLISNYPFMREGVTLIKSIVLAKDKKVNEAIKLLKKFASENVDSQLRVKLTAVQLLLTEVRKEKMYIYYFSNKMKIIDFNTKFILRRVIKVELVNCWKVWLSWTTSRVSLVH